MIEQIVGVAGAIAVIAGSFFGLVAVTVWIVDSPGRKEDRERRKRHREE